MMTCKLELPLRTNGSLSRTQDSSCLVDESIMLANIFYDSFSNGTTKKS